MAIRLNDYEKETVLIMREKGFSDWKILKVIFDCREKGQQGFRVDEPEFRYIPEAIQEVAGKQPFSEMEAVKMGPDKCKKAVAAAMGRLPSAVWLKRQKIAEKAEKAAVTKKEKIALLRAQLAELEGN